MRVYESLEHGERNRRSGVNNGYPWFVPPARIGSCSFAAERIVFSVVPASIKPPSADEVFFHFARSLKNTVLNSPKQVIYLFDPRGGIEQLQRLRIPKGRSRRTKPLADDFGIAKDI